MKPNEGLILRWMDTIDQRLRKFEKIKQVVAEFFHLSVEELEKADRRRTTTIPRQIAIYLAKQQTGASLSEIGRYFGQHHTSVLQSIAKIDEQRRTVPEVGDAVEKLIQSL